VRTVQDITFDVTGQLIYFDAPEGRPSSVTSVSVFPWDTSDEQTAESATGAGSVETGPNTTLDGDAGSSAADPRLVPLLATTDVAIERTYRVTAASGAFEWVEVESISSGVSVTAKHPLHNIYASGATFQSTRIQATVDSTWVADTANLSCDDCGPNPAYRVRWVYVVGGVTYVADSYFNLVRYVGTHGVRPQDIEVMSPGWLDRLPTDHRNDQGRRLIADAYRGVKIDLHQIDMAASSLAESEIVDELVRYKAIELGESARFIAGGVEADRVQFATQRYTARLDSLLRIVARVPFRDETGAATPVIAVGLTRR
jgi:hypothetical protein